jgi:hypothetical protein
MNTLAYLKDNQYTGINDIDKLKSQFFKQKIYISYEPLEKNKTYRRVIFSCSKNVRKQQALNEICCECNGLILETDGVNWKPLLIPLHTPKSNINSKLTNNLIKCDTFDIYKVLDGTVIGLYFHDRNNKWVISTSRGYDMNDSIFNTKSFETMLEEILLNFKTDKSLSLQEFYDTLDKNCCYSFGITHPDLHLFKEGNVEDIYRIWFIQSVNLNDLNLPINRNFNENYHDLIKNQPKINFTVNNTHCLFTKLKNAYNEFVKTGNVNYGYLLISKNYKSSHDHSVILLESALMHYIRNLIYDSSYTNFIKDRDYNRETTIALNSYLDKARSDIFISLFPQFKDKFIAYSNLEDDLSRSILENIQGNNNENDGIKLKVINYLTNEIRNLISLDLHDNKLEKIKDIIHNSKYFDLYYSLIPINSN